MPSPLPNASHLFNDTYRNATPDERRAIKKELRHLGRIEKQSRPIREDFKRRIDAIKDLPEAEREVARKAIEAEFEPVRGQLTPPKVPITLMACFTCRRPTGRCICKTADGRPLDWREGDLLEPLETQGGIE